MIKFGTYLNAYAKRAYFTTALMALTFSDTLNRMGFPFTDNCVRPHAHGYVVAWDDRW